MSLLLFLFLPLLSCDRASSRKLGQKVGELNYESTRNTEEFIKGTMEATRQKREEEHGPVDQEKPSTGSNVQQALQRLEDKRRSQDKGFPGHASENPFKPKSYQGFPGHQK